MANSSLQRTCLVIGAGISGVIAARRLHQAGIRVTIIDKGRNYGGRMATRRIDNSLLDHGAQSIDLDPSNTASPFHPLINTGVLRPWYSDASATHYGSTRGMSGAVEMLAEGLDVRLATRVNRVALQDNRQWAVYSDNDRIATAQMLLLTAPAPQSLTLLEESDIALQNQVRRRLRAITYDKCLTLMAIYDQPVTLSQSGWRKTNNPAAEWMADNQTKGMSEQSAITVQASSAFSEEYFDAPPEETTERMLDALESFACSQPSQTRFHRWRYSRTTVSDAEPCLISRSPITLAFAGDGFAGRGIVGAAESGEEVARLLIDAADKS